MKTTSATPKMWAARYETLRRYVLDNPQSLGAEPLGLVLLVRHGVAAWMRSWRELATSPVSQPSSAPVYLACPPTPDWQRQLTVLLAQMTSAHLSAPSTL